MRVVSHDAGELLHVTRRDRAEGEGAVREPNIKQNVSIQKRKDRQIERERSLGVSRQLYANGFSEYFDSLDRTGIFCRDVDKSHSRNIDRFFVSS